MMLASLKPRMLIVDDDIGFSEVKADFFGEFFETKYALEIDQAKAKFVTFRPHVLLTGFRWLGNASPGLLRNQESDLETESGLDLCHWVRTGALCSEILIVACTGYYSPAAAQGALNAGANLCLPKPVDNCVLIRTILDLTDFGDSFENRVNTIYPKIPI